MYLDPDDSLHLRDGIGYELDETFIVKDLVKPHHIAVDVGAHIGYYTLIMARQAKQVYAFEPSPDNFKILGENILLNNYTNVTVYKAAVGDTNGTADLWICETNSGMHRIYPSKWTKSKLEIMMIRLDALDHIDFLKIDAEGSEAGVIRGMGKHRPTILMEFNADSIIEYGGGRPDLELIKLGYHIYKVGKKTLLCQPIL